MNKMIRFFRAIIHDLIIILMPKEILSKTLSCEEVAKSILDHNEQNSKKPFRIRLHMFICQCCTDYDAQLKIIKLSSKTIGQVNLTPEQFAALKNSKENVLNKMK